MEGERTDVNAAKEFVFTIENTVNDAALSLSTCESHEDALVVIDSGASVNVCTK